MENNGPSPEPRPHTPPSIWTTWNRFRQVGLFFVLLCGDFFFQILIHQAVGGWFVSALGGAILGVLLPLILLQRLTGFDVVGDFSLGPTSVTTLVLTGLFAASSLVPTSLLAELSLRLHPADPEWISSLQDNLPTTASGYAVAFIAAALAGPLAEELMFRGWLQRLTTRTWGTSAGVIVSSLVFGLIHGEPWYIFGLIGIGVMLAFVFMATRSVWACWVAHALHNTLSLILMMAGDELQTEPTSVSGGDWIWLGVSVLGLVSFGWLLWIRRPIVRESRPST